MQLLAEPAHLLYCGTLFGSVSRVICHQGTWFGLLDITIDHDSPVGSRLREFAAFSEACSARQGDQDAPGPAQFAPFLDIFDGWMLRSADGATTHQIEDSPLFVGGARSHGWSKTRDCCGPSAVNFNSA